MIYGEVKERKSTLDLLSCKGEKENHFKGKKYHRWCPLNYFQKFPPNHISREAASLSRLVFLYQDILVSVFVYNYLIRKPPSLVSCVFLKNKEFLLVDFYSSKTLAHDWNICFWRMFDDLMNEYTE